MWLAILSGAAGGTVLFQSLPTPAASSSSGSSLHHGASGRLYLTWQEATAKGHALRLSVWEEDQWSPPRTIQEGNDWFVNWADFPSLIEYAPSRLAAHWLVRNGKLPHAYDIYLVLSQDAGEQWSEPFRLHRDDTQTEHGFVSFLPWTGDQLGVVWLDGREMSEEGQEGSMSLRFTTVPEPGRLGREVILDDRVCECCQTSAALTGRGAIVVYRDRSPDEIRDIWSVRYQNGTWSEPSPVYSDGWKIGGCPVNGPAVAASGEFVAVAWFTGAPRPRVQMAISWDGGETFQDPVPMDDGHPLGRVDVEVLADYTVLVSWMEGTKQGAEIRLRKWKPGEVLQPSLGVTASSPMRASGFPRLGWWKDRLFFTWTQASNPPRVQTGVLRFP